MTIYQTCKQTLTDILRGGRFNGKIRSEDRVYQNARPIGGSFGEVSESLHFLRSAQRPRLSMGDAWR